MGRETLKFEQNDNRSFIRCRSKGVKREGQLKVLVTLCLEQETFIFSLEREGFEGDLEDLVGGSFTMVTVKEI